MHVNTVNYVNVNYVDYFVISFFSTYKLTILHHDFERKIQYCSFSVVP